MITLKGEYYGTKVLKKYNDPHIKYTLLQLENKEIKCIKNTLEISKKQNNKYRLYHMFTKPGEKCFCGSYYGEFLKYELNLNDKQKTLTIFIKEFELESPYKVVPCNIITYFTSSGFNIIKKLLSMK